MSLCLICNRDYALRADGKVRAHGRPEHCAGSGLPPHEGETLPERYRSQADLLERTSPRLTTAAESLRRAAAYAEESAQIVEEIEARTASIVLREALVWPEPVAEGTPVTDDGHTHLPVRSRLTPAVPGGLGRAICGAVVRYRDDLTERPWPADLDAHAREQGRRTAGIDNLCPLCVHLMGALYPVWDRAFRRATAARGRTLSA